MREFIAGPVAAWPLCALVPLARRYLSPAAARSCATRSTGPVTVRAEASPPEVEVQFDVDDVAGNAVR